MILYRKAQSGTIVTVSSKDDPRYKSYSDSLQVYNGAMNDIRAGRGYNILPKKSSEQETQKTYKEWGNRDYKALLSKLQNPAVHNKTVSVAEIGGDYKDLYKGVESLKYGNIYSTDPNYDPWLRKGIEPIKIMFNDFSQDMPIYKKPEQKVVVEGSKEWEAMKNQEVLKAAGLYNGEIDGVWGPKSQAAWDEYMKEDEATPEEEAVDSAWALLGKKSPKEEIKVEEKKEEPSKKESTGILYKTKLVEDQVITGYHYDANGKRVPTYKKRLTRIKL